MLNNLEKTRISVSKETQALPSTICENVGKPYVNIERIPSDILGEHLAYESNITNDTEHSQVVLLNLLILLL